MNYDALRHFADSWGLILMGLIFLVLIGWTFRPGSRSENKDAAHMIFEEDQDNG